MSTILKPLNILRAQFIRLRNYINSFFKKQNKSSYKENVLRNFLQNIEAADVMIQRSDTKSINFTDSTEVILKKIENCEQDIIPVYQDNIDDVKGCVRVEDIYKKLFYMYNNSMEKGKKPIVKLGENHLRSIILNFMIVSPSMPLATLLNNMQIDKVGMVVVADEFGGSQGFITSGSIMKYLAQECDNTEIKLKPDNNGRIRTDAKMDLEDFLYLLENYLSSKKQNKQNFEIINHIKNNLEESRTLGGFICSFTGKIPAVNTNIVIGEVVFYIVEASIRKVNTVEFTVKDL